MKKKGRCISINNRYRLHYWLWILLIILISHVLDPGKSQSSELISLNTKNEPLSEVLDNVSRSTGYELVVDEIWNDLLITVKFDAIPLDQALKRILAHMNHAIVYQSDSKVLIKIYGKDSGIPGHTGASGINRLSPEPAYQPLSIETPTSPNPVPPEPINAEAESEESDASSRQTETSDEKNENEEDTENSNEDSQTESPG
jgi:hypothetical protein